MGIETDAVEHALTERHMRPVFQGHRPLTLEQSARQRERCNRLLARLDKVGDTRSPSVSTQLGEVIGHHAELAGAHSVEPGDAIARFFGRLLCAGAG